MALAQGGGAVGRGGGVGGAGAGAGVGAGVPGAGEAPGVAGAVRPRGIAEQRWPIGGRGNAWRRGRRQATRARRPPPGPSGGAGGRELASLLRPTATTAVRAQVLPAQRLLLPKRRIHRLHVGKPPSIRRCRGMTTCVMATDTFGVDGKVVLLERGTKLIGETRGQVQQGAARIFVVWTEARTPTGVVVPLDSPGADELGRAGLPGEVDTHFWQRFGAAMLVSVIDGAVQTGIQSSRGAQRHHHREPHRLAGGP